jgi:metal-responsive CopG/Arc/MetJ family transcriptional regulator
MIYCSDIEVGSLRTLVDIPDEDLKLITKLTKKRAISRAEFVREAIGTALAPYRRKMEHKAFGLWTDLKEDGIEYQERLRSEW